MRLFGLALLGLLLGSSSRVGDSSSLELRLAVLESPIKAGQGVVVRVTATNESDQIVSYQNTNPVCNYSFKVLTGAGQPAPKTDFKKQMSCPKGETETTGRNILVRLKPGESRSEDLRLNEQYVFAQPGEYLIQVSRAFPGLGDFSSNIAYLSVTEP